MDPMVSARVPLELRDQVNEGLRAIGSTPTELINSAYQYFLEHKMLPSDLKTPTRGKKRLSVEKMQDLAQSIETTTLQVEEESFKGLSYKELLRQELKDRYESLA